ncbi:MAG: hypothetical protein PHQ44_07465, partial [Anaerovibrio sp.]|nr:hypothetical protein [Anaerovibrio sp.]
MAVKWIALQAGQGGNIMLEKMDLKHLLLLLMAAIWVAGLYPERALAETNAYCQYAAELRHCAGTPD